MNSHPGWMLVFLGLVLAAGLAWIFAPNVPWLGRLPGDIRIENENTRVYVPIITCILLSVVASVLLWIIGRMWR